MAPQPPKPGMKSIDIAKKRKEPPHDAGKDNRPAGSRFHKRVKVQDARSLRTQPADAALSNGELDLQAFLSAREFEIRALTDGMRKSKAVNNRRAFQLVPRGMRRRTASHNVKKLPTRLRPRARREQAEDNTPNIESRRRKPKTARGRIRVEMAKRLGLLAEKKRKRKLREAKEKAKESAGGEGKSNEVSAAMKQLIETRPARPKIRRNLLNDPPKPKAKFRKRQIDKTWLPTHLWHAKRAKMTLPKDPLWRFSIPLTPTEKVYRPTHRASTVKGAIVWDMSYMSTIGLYGHGPGVERTLRGLGLSHDSLWDHRGNKWREGRRKWSGMLSKQTGDTRRQIGPATVLWDPEAAPAQVTDETPQTAEKAQRQVYIRLHPSCFLEVFNILISLIKRETPRLYVEDLRFEIGSIELTGPGATEALLGILHPYQKDDTKEAHARLFESLTVTNSAILPSDSVLGFSSQDPRLSYPPRAVQAETTANNASTARLEDLNKALADTTPSPHLLFNRDARFKASCFPSQKALNRRKGTNPPGKPLEVTNADPPFPVIIFTSRSSTSKSSAQGTWTLLAPWKCILPIWYSLVHYPLSTGGNPRIGGLNELRQVTFEQGLPWFPGDFPGTDAGAEWELEQRQNRKADWERRPKSKKVAWESLDLGAGRKGEVGLGWTCEFERLFGLQQNEEKAQSSGNDAEIGTEMIRAGSNKMDLDGEDEEEVERGAQVGESHANGNKSQPTKNTLKEAVPHPLRLIHHLSKGAFNALSILKPAGPPPTYSVITIKITFLGRGVVDSCARIYRLPPREANATTQSSTEPEVPATQEPLQSHTLPTDIRAQWLAKLSNSSADKPSSTKGNSQRICFPPNSDHDTQKLLLAKSLMFDKVPFPPEKSTSGDKDHPLVPNEEDLIGYVTKGEFSLAEGKAVAIGCVSAEKALEALNTGGEREGRVCIVRNAGEPIGWVARWEAV